MRYGIAAASALVLTLLVAVDAEGRTLSTRWTSDRTQSRIEVDDGGAVYPVVIDPWVQQEKLTAGGDGARCGTDGAIRYVGSWTADNWSGAYGDTRHYARAPGAYAELSFERTSGAVMTQTRPGHGITAISVDGGPAERVDTYSDPAQEQVVVWQTNGLTSGIHTIRVTVTGAQNDAAINNWVAFHAIIVRP